MANNEERYKKISQVIYEKFWVDYAANTTLLSKGCRQIAFGEGALCWFFKSPTASFPQPIYSVLYFLMFFVIFDILQYFVSQEIYRYIAKKYEKKLNSGLLNNENEVIKNNWINFPGRFCFLMKFLFLCVSSFLLLAYFHMLKIL